MASKIHTGVQNESTYRNVMKCPTQKSESQQIQASGTAGSIGKNILTPQDSRKDCDAICDGTCKL